MPLRELPRRQLPERRMRPELIVVSLPLGSGTASLKDRYDDLGVEQLVADATVERLDMGVLRRLTRIRKA